MTEINENVKKVCSFYASDWHLVTMLLPNIDKKINEGARITTIFEKDTEAEMGVLLERINLKDKEKIMNIGWKKFNGEEKEIREKLKNNDYIIISGTKEYNDRINKEIDDIIAKENSEYNRKINIVNCYNIDEVKYSIKEIIEEHEKILNTAGEKDKEEYIVKIAN